MNYYYYYKCVPSCSVPLAFKYVSKRLFKPNPVVVKLRVHLRTYIRVTGALSYSSPILMVGESAWITSIGSWRTWVRALNCEYKRLLWAVWRGLQKWKDIIEYLPFATCYACRKLYHHHFCRSLNLTSSWPPQAAVCSTSLQYFSNSSGSNQKHTHVHVHSQT